MIVGIDEVGRGPWAGPLVVGAVILSSEIEGVTDSKKLSKHRRELLAEEIQAHAVGIGLGWVSASEIDEWGLSRSLEEATKRAITELESVYVGSYTEIIIDGTVNFLQNTGKGRYVTTMKKADLLIPSVSAASIVAKVARDAYMKEQDAVYPGYGFSEHVGYGTKKHREAINRLGVTSLHRLSFAPLHEYQTTAIVKHTEQSSSMKKTTTKLVGDAAEDAVSKYLQKHGHAIIDRNWKTKWCEVDIISRSDGTLYFTEVKYRKNASHGDGLAAITSKKLRQMSFAARAYVSMHTSELDIQLAVASVSDETYLVEKWFAVD